MRTARLLFTVSVLLFASIARAQKPIPRPNDSNVLFSLLHYSGVAPEPYGTLYEDKGYLRIFTEGSQRLIANVKNEDGKTKLMRLCDYDLVVSDSVLDVIYPIAKKAVAKKKKELKKLEKKREKYARKHPDEPERLGGSRRTVNINIRDVKFMYSSSSVTPLSDINSDFWNKMEQIRSIIESYVRGYSQEDVDEMTENGKFPMPFKIDIYKR